MIILVENSEHSIKLASELSKDTRQIYILPYERLDDHAWAILSPFIQFMPPAQQDSYVFESLEKLQFQIKSLAPRFLINTLSPNKSLEQFLRLICEKQDCRYIDSRQVMQKDHPPADQSEPAASPMQANRQNVDIAGKLQLIMQNYQGIFPLKYLFDLFQIPRSTVITRKDSLTLAEKLQQNGYEITPPLALYRILSSDSEMFIYPAPHIAQEDQASADRFLHACTLLILSFSVALADDHMAPEEEKLLRDIIKAEAQNLNYNQKQRLYSLNDWLQKNKVTWSQIQVLLEKRTGDECQDFAKYILRMIGIDDVVDDDEIALLQKIYDKMGLSPDQCQQDIDALQQQIDLKNADIADHHYTVSVQPALADLFQEETQALAPIITREIGTLDIPHRDILNYILENPHLDFDDFEQKCRSHRLMPDGVQDSLNEWALEIYDDFLFLENEAEDEEEADLDSMTVSFTDPDFIINHNLINNHILN